MPPFVERFALDPVAQLAGRELLAWGTLQFYAFVLVLLRMAGLLTIGPLLGQPLVPGNVRILLVLSLGFLVTPTLSARSDAGFAKLDVDGNGRLVRSEVPEALLPRFDRLLARSGLPEETGLDRQTFRPPLQVPGTVLAFAWVGATEFALGLVLGLGVQTLLSGLELAGTLFDDQSGLGFARIVDPSFHMDSTVTGRLMYLLGVSAWLLLEPVGGHLRMVGTLIETFETLPAGEAFVSASAVDYLSDLVHQSLLLGVQVAAPMLAVMSLASLAMGFLGHSVPQVNVLVLGFAVRPLISLLVLALTLSGAARAVVDAVPTVLDDLARLLGHVS